ncbi:Major Facilitator Superfamily protein [Coccidioides posadasii C735 delta SOWgp]|uniref:Major Facilitator Superfamily protein n=1 Tax=Coccidioides posadasii (strain C735) TaxID=222929 RepID=C5P0U1_COCP7|nr:Major Facilitator Superfamily protein [Coccidioides posadasii C735 delta SOWgp]EER29299.1 Major Facilitator Superfamily protein [Coccidioides posadasii C735 delta SOWgp]|eukprot:XP_003071444.1 Major Facilitator Superfamily protein [Coccidioides posadasii C735 delta SOWgp]
MFYAYKKIKARTAPKQNSQETCSHQLRLQNLQADSRPSEEAIQENDVLMEGSDGPIVPKPEETHNNDGPCSECKKEKHVKRVYRWKLIFGLLLPYFLASVDLTIVAAALPFIASHFNRLDELNWIVTSFSLTSTAFIPAFGQLADVFGRHFVLQLAMFLMLIGSVLCAAAQTWPMLLLGRALQGTSSAGIMNLIQIILSDKVSLADNAKNSTIFQFVAGISYGVGPVIGGYLTQSNWRYCFVLSIPVAFVAHIAIFVVLRKELVGGTYFTKGSRRSSFLEGLGTVDIGGTLLFICSVSLIIIGTSWGGATYPWTSPAVLAPLIIGSILFVLFFIYEYLLGPGRILARCFPSQTVMIPSELFRKRDMVVLAIIEFATGAAMFSAFYFVGIYFTLVEAYSPERSGLQLLFYIPGIGAGVYFAMFACNVWPAHTFYPLSVGTVTESVGIGLITWAITRRQVSLVNGMMAVAGAGTGMRFMPCTLHAAGIWPDKIAPAMSIMRFSMPFGGTLALAIMGSVFNNKMAPVFRSMNSGLGGHVDTHVTQSLDFISDLPEPMQSYVRNTGKDAVMWAFVSITPIMAISLVAIIFLGNVWIKSSKAKEAMEKAKREGTHDDGIVSSEVIDKPYLLALITGSVEENKYVSTPLSKADKERQAQALLEEKAFLRARRYENKPRDSYMEQEGV